LGKIDRGFDICLYILVNVCESEYTGQHWLISGDILYHPEIKFYETIEETKISDNLKKTNP
jgi:hypothetical protein